MEKQIIWIEGVLDRAEKRLNHIENDLSGFQRELNENVRALRDRINLMFRWIIGMMTVMWITIFLAILLGR